MPVGVRKWLADVIAPPERFTGVTTRQGGQVMFVLNERVERLAGGAMWEGIVGFAATHQVIGVIKQGDPFCDGISGTRRGRTRGCQVTSFRLLERWRTARWTEAMCGALSSH